MLTANADLMHALVDIAEDAGRAILKVYETDFDVEFKGDDSPLTQADMAAHRIIVAALEALTPNVPVLSEESKRTDIAARGNWTRYWLVDPLDGTKEFVKRNGEFTVNIALIDAGRPVAGVVHVPVPEVSYFGAENGGAWRIERGGEPRAIATAVPAAPPYRVVCSRSHRDAATEAFIGRLGPHEVIAVGSSLKFCLVAEGEADVYPRFGPTSYWDTAAAHAVVAAAGGHVVDLEGESLRYPADGSLLNPAFMVYGDGEREWMRYAQHD